MKTGWRHGCTADGCGCVPSANSWKKYPDTFDFSKHQLFKFEIVEFLAAENAPSGIFKKGDIVESSPALMNCSLFSHWREIGK